MKKLIFIGLVSWLACSAVSDDTADIEIYTDYPVGYWEIGGTGVLNPIFTGLHHSFGNSMQVTLTAGTNLQFTQTWGGENINGCTQLEFWARAAAAGSQQFNISARVRGNWGASQPLSRYATLSPSTWRRVRVPLADLGVSPGDAIQVISFDNPSGTSDFYLDDVKLIKPSFSGTTAVQVDASNVLRTLSARMFGVGTSMYDTEMLSSSSISKMSDAGISFLNYPGGDNADEYDWQANRNTRDGTTPTIDTDRYLQTADAIGAEKMITVNYGSGTPEQAAAWVNYVNNIKNANVIYWSIGNEVYQDAEYDTHPFPHDALTYAQFVRDAMLLMKAVDPRIKIGVVGTISERDYPQRVSVVNPRTGNSANGWAPVMLSTLFDAGTLPDYYDAHFYPLAPNTESDSALLQKSSMFDFWLSMMRPMLSDYLGAAGQALPILLTETNSSWKPAGKQTTSLTNGLYLADLWGRTSKAGVESFVWWKLHEIAQNDGNLSAALYGWRSIGTFGLLSNGLPVGMADPVNTPYPTFFAMKALSKFARSGDYLVAAQSNNDLLSVYAVKSASTNKLRFLVINKAKNRDFTAVFTVSNYTPAAQARVFRYGKSQDAASQGVVQSQVSSQARPAGSATTVRFTFSRYSITVVEL